MELLEYLKTKLNPIEYEFAKKMYSDETKVFMETLERFRKHFMDELKIMRNDITINGFDNEND